MLDRNGDGRIDQAEIDQIPPQFAEMMKSRGITIRPGVSVEDFRSNMRSQFEQMRESGEGFRPQMRTENRGPAANRSEYKPASPFRPRDKERMTVDLPPKWSELDTDFDGQVGLYEWIVARRESLGQFDEIDSDLDGLLTPRELKEFDELSSEADKKAEALAARYERPRLMIVGGQYATNNGRKSNGKSLISDEDKKRHTEYATTKAFPYLDTNKDGKVTPEEMQASRRIRPMFEKAGIKIETMSQEEFSNRYIQAMEFFAEQKAKEREDKK